MFTLFLKGGIMMWALLAASIWGLYIVIYQYRYLKRNRLPVHLISRLKDQLLQSGKEHTLGTLEAFPQFSVQLLAVALQSSDQSDTAIQSEIHKKLQGEFPKIDRDMAILSSIIMVAPILGLLGTVLGLIDIFNVISGGNYGDPSLMSSGIAQALISTVTGLGISVPFIFFYHVLSHKMDQYRVSLENSVNSIVQFCRSASQG